MPGLVPMVSHDQKSHDAPYFNCLDLRNTMVWCMGLSTSHDGDTNAVALHDTNTNASGIMWCQGWCQWYHMTKSHVASHFNCHYLRNAMVPFVMHWHHVMQAPVPMLHLVLIIFTKNAVVSLMMPLASHNADASANSVKWLKISCCILFQSSCPNKCIGVIDDVISVMWCQQWYDKKLMLHRVSIILT